MGATEGRRFSATKLVNAAKFALSQASYFLSPSNTLGLQANGNVKGEGKKNVVMLEEMNKTRQQCRAPTDRNEAEEEPLKRLFDATPQRNIFIRSRL